MNRSIFAIGITLTMLTSCSHPVGPRIANAPQPVVNDAPALQQTTATPQVTNRATATTPAQPTPQGTTGTSSSRMPPGVIDDLDRALARLEDALFDYDRATIRPDAMTVLRGDVDVIRDILKAYPAEKLVIEGHADPRGSSEYNLALGDKRADTVRDFLASMGVSKVQLTVISFGAKIARRAAKRTKSAGSATAASTSPPPNSH